MPLSPYSGRDAQRPGGPPSRSVSGEQEDGDGAHHHGKAACERGLRQALADERARSAPTAVEPASAAVCGGVGTRAGGRGGWRARRGR